MASNRTNSRKSFAFSTPQQVRRTGSSQPRFSMSNVEDEPDKPDKDTNDLFETLMAQLTTDPLKKALFMQNFLSNNKVDKSLLNVMKKKANNNRPPVKKKTFESPTTQFRRRALKAQDTDNLSSDGSLSDDLPRSSAPFDHLLKGIVAYVEIMSNDQDKSGGVKALLTSMGARIVDKIRRGVTHVIFKDGSFQTCRKAKLVNAHLVSVLWVEAVRRNHCKVPEDKYPALATQAFNANVSDLCEELQREYDDVVRDEMERGGSLKRSVSCDLASRYSEDIVPPSQECDARSIVTIRKPKKSIPAPVRLEFSPEVTSDSDSDMELINGEIINRPPSLDLTRSSMGSIERDAIEAINMKLNDFESTPSTDQSKLDNSNQRNSSVQKADNSRNSSSRKNSVSEQAVKENVNGKRRNTNKSLTNLRISSEKGDTESSPLSELQISDCLGKKLSRNARRKTVMATYSKELASVLDNSKKSGTESRQEISDSANKKSPRNTRRATVNSSTNDLSQLRLSDPVKNLSRKNNRKSVGQRISDTSSERSSGVSDLSKKGDGALSDSENSDPADEKLPRRTLRKTMNSSVNDLSQLRVSDPVKNISRKNNAKSSAFMKSDKSKRPSGDLDLSKKDGGKSIPLSDSENSDPADEILPRSTRRKTINSSVNDLSQLRVSDPVKNTSRKNNCKSPALMKSDTSTKRSTGVLDSSKKVGGESIPLSNSENSAHENLPLSTRRKAINSSANDLSPLRISDPVKSTSDNNDGEFVHLRISDPKEPAGVSEPISTLRISDASSKRRQTVSSTMSSLRISTASSKSNDAKLPNIESPPKIPTDNVTVRKKRPIKKNTFLNASDKSDNASDKSDNASSDKSDNASDKSDNTSDKTDNTSTQPKQNFRKGKRRLYDPNDPVLLKTPINKPIHKKKSEKLPIVSNVEIATVLMTPRAKALLQKKNPDIVLNFDDDSEIDVEDKRTKVCSPPKKAKTQPEPTKNLFKEPKTPGRQKAQSQKNLAATPTRRSARKSVCVSQSDDNFDADEDGIRSQRNRRSTQDFLPKETFKSQTKLKNTQSKQRRTSSIVCSRFHRPEVNTFLQIVNKLGRFYAEDEVTEKTSHLVIAESKRTINLLRAIARGCWVLKSEWLYRSLEAGKWLQEEDYELTDYSPAVQQSRQQRQAFGALYSMDIFKSCGNIYIAKSSNPRCSDLQELVTLCKGRITTICRNAKIVVGEHVEGDDVTCVTENWVLDSITFYKKKSLKNYVIEPPPSRRQSEDY